MQVKSKKFYYPWIDLLKTISIFGVVYIHSGGFNPAGITADYFRFCVPIFIITSFFLTERQKIDERPTLTSTFTFWKKRLPRILIPYTGWTIFYTLVQHMQGQALELRPIWGWQGQYYLVILLQLTLVYPVLRLVKPNIIFLVLSFIFTLLFLYLPFSYLKLNPPFILSGCSPFIYWIFYVFLAIYLARKYDGISSRFENLSLPLRLAIFTLLPFFMCLEKLVLNRFLTVDVDSYLRLSTLFCSTFIFLILLGANVPSSIKLFFNFPMFVNSAIRSMSKWTLGIYCLNPLIIHSIEYFFRSLDFINILHTLSIEIQFAIFLLIGILVCYVAIILSKVISYLGGMALVQ